MKTKNIIIQFITILVSSITLAVSADTLTEVEENNSFSTAQIVDASTGATILGTLTPFDSSFYDYQFSGTLSTGGVDHYSATDLVAGDSFIAVINNNLASNIDFGPDTLLATLDESSNIIDIDDDSSPYGDDLASMVNGTVNQDGTINLAVSGYPDFGFIGDHTEEGNYDLFITLGDTTAPSDVDFYTFVNLTPGDMFVAEILNGEIDSMLGLFDSTGTLLMLDDDGGTDFFSLLTGYVPENGSVTVAVTGFDDSEILGLHGEVGNYSLGFETTAVVPLPASIWLFLSGLGLLVASRKKS